MSHAFYKVIHLSGVFMLFAGLCALWGASLRGPVDKGTRIGLAMIHGLGMAFILVGGFGMLAKLGYMVDIPTWAYIKFAIWLLLGASMVMAKRKAQWGLPLLIFWILVGTYAAYLGVYKP